MNYFPAFRSGLSFGFNPLAVTTILVFMLFLSFQGKTRLRVFVLGFFYILVAFLSIIVFSLGLFDQILINPYIQKGARILYSVMAGIFVILGFLYFQDWFSSKKKGGEILFFMKEPSILRRYEKVKGKALVLISLILSSICLSFFFIILSCLWPQDEYAFIILSSLLAKSNVGLARLALGVYGIAFVFPLFCVWLVFLGIAYSNRIQKIFMNIVSQRRIMLSSIFLSMGFGLVYVILEASPFVKGG